MAAEEAEIAALREKLRAAREQRGGHEGAFEMPQGGTKIKVLCATWNLGGARPEASLEHWLHPGR